VTCSDTIDKTKSAYLVCYPHQILVREEFHTYMNVHEVVDRPLFKKLLFLLNRSRRAGGLHMLLMKTIVEKVGQLASKIMGSCFSEVGILSMGHV